MRGKPVRIGRSNGGGQARDHFSHLAVALGWNWVSTVATSATNTANRCTSPRISGAHLRVPASIAISRKKSSSEFARSRINKE